MRLFSETPTMVKTISFYKEGELWFADIPEYIESGLGNKANLLMVDGADSFLDYISLNGNWATLKISTCYFVEAQFVLEKMRIGLNINLLNAIGHAPVNYGAYYQVEKLYSHHYKHQLWLCPVAEYIFGGNYPANIYIQLLNNK
jgi:hypothetical protein